jgi:hypothetical protein
MTAVRGRTSRNPAALPIHSVEVFTLLNGGLRDGGRMGAGRPKGRHVEAILPGQTHSTLGASALLATVTLAFGQSGVGRPTRR